MEQETIWIIAIVALAVGVLIGFLMGKSGSSETQRKTLEEELNGSRAEMDRYKEEVTTHFEQTAALVNELTEQYRKVHQHLATGAQNLCPDQAAGRSLQSSLQPKLEKSASESERSHTTEIEQPSSDDSSASVSTEKSTSMNTAEAQDTETVEATIEETKKEDQEIAQEPPRDWAPKSPNDEGTLSDRYGLKKNTEESPNPPQPDPGLNEDESENIIRDKKDKT